MALKDGLAGPVFVNRLALIASGPKDAAVRFLTVSVWRASQFPHFHCDCTREENVVFKMDVLVQIFLERCKTLVQGLVAHTGIGWRREVVAGFAQGAQRTPGRVMFVFH